MRRNSGIHTQGVEYGFTLYDPIDFCLHPNQISTLSCPSVSTDFEFIIDNRSYKCNKSLARSVFSHVNELLNNNPEMDKVVLKNISDPKCYFQLIQIMLSGEIITINEENAFFLNFISTTLGNEELKNATQLFMKRYKLIEVNANNNNIIIQGELLPPTWYQKLFFVIVRFLSNISIIFRIFLFLCELIGFAIGFAFIFNLFMVPLTSGFISLNMKDVFRYGLMIPYFLFNINIVSLIEILTFYICTSNHFISNQPIPKHRQLLRLIKVVWPFCNKPVEVKFSEFQLSVSPLINSNQTANNHPDRAISENDQTLQYLNEQVQTENSHCKCSTKYPIFFFCGKHNLYNTILGIVLILFLGSAILPNGFRQLVVIFSVFLPTVLIGTVFVLYSIHALLSVFPKARAKFIEHNDFSDPFINSMYFSESRWVTFFQKICKNRGQDPPRKSISLFPQTITRSSASLTNFKEDDYADDDFANANLNKIWPICCLNGDSLLYSFLVALFSKSTCGFFISFGLLLLLIVEHAQFNGYQIFYIILVIIILLNPLMCSINFNFLLIQYMTTHAYSELQVKMQDKWMHSSQKRQKWLNLWFTWSKDATPIRVARIVFLVFYIFALIASIFPAVVFKQNDLVDQPTNTTLFANPEIYELYKRATSNIYLMNPVCEVRSRNLTIAQLSALSEASYQLADDDPTLDQMLRVFFGNNWNSTLHIIDDAPKSIISHSNVRHFIYDNNLHIISIRGTANTIDVLADIELWASSFIMNILSSSIPIFNSYVAEYRILLGYTMHFPRYMFKPFSLINGYIEIITDFVNTIKIGNGTEIILLGHSLGGGLAKLVSTLTGYRAFSFSGPGIQALNAFYTWKNEHIAESFTNVMPLLDPVSSVDQATGSSFMIPCKAGMFSCHNIIRTMCMLATLCNEINIEIFSFCVSNLDYESMKSIIEEGTPYSYVS